MVVVKISLTTTYVPMHFPKSFPSDTLFICAPPKPKSDIKANSPRNDIAKATIPSAVGAKLPQSFARMNRPTRPITAFIPWVNTISIDFLAIIHL